MRWKNWKMRILIGLVIAGFIYFLMVMFCGGFALQQCFWLTQGEKQTIFLLFFIRATCELIEIGSKLSIHFIVSFVNVSYNISTNFINFTLYVSINVEKIHLCGIASLSCSELFAYHSGIIKNSLFADSLQKCETLLGLSILHCQKPEVFWLPQWIRKGLGLGNLYPRWRRDYRWWASKHLTHRHCQSKQIFDFF